MLAGVSSGPLIALASFVDPALVFTALAGTALIFASFSLAALLADQKSFLFLGGLSFNCEYI